MEPISEEIRAEIRKIVNEELDRKGISLLKATCPPKLLQALLVEFPYLLSDSPEWKTRNDSLPILRNWLENEEKLKKISTRGDKTICFKGNPFEMTIQLNSVGDKESR